MLMFGWDFEGDNCSRFWRWNLIKICVRPCNMNSTLGSVVPLAMFTFSAACSLSNHAFRAAIPRWEEPRIGKGSNWRNLKQDQKAIFTCSLLFPFQIKYKEIQEFLFPPSVSCARAWTSMIILDSNPKSVFDRRSLILVLKLCYFDNSRIPTI